MSSPCAIAQAQATAACAQLSTSFVITPYQSLSDRGANVLYAVLGAAVGIVQLPFLLRGYWPVTVFSLLDLSGVLLALHAFRCCQRERKEEIVIEDGILKGYMQDRLNARLMGVAPTGNGRRESFQHAPMPRMTNTFMLSGDKTPEEIIASVKKGIYAVSFGGGQVDITSGKFVFGCTEAYLIENGKIGAPVKGAMLIGNGPDAMKRISMIGNDTKLDTGIGNCGKAGQWVPVGVGQPHLRMDQITVGGTKA